MERVHDAIEWYQKKIGSYDKQLWEQSVEKKLQKQPEFVRQNAPRRKVRPKTEYIDVDLIRGSTFTKTKPQVPWVYVTKKALARVLFFPFYYSWWVHQTSGWAYVCLLCLYFLQVSSICVYVSAEDSHLEDELSFTEVVLPMILMFLLCLIHSQTVLAHITHKPPKHKPISGVTRKIKPKVKKAAPKVNNLVNNKSSYPDVGSHANLLDPTKQSDSVNGQVYANQASHTSLLSDRELNCQQPSVRSPTVSQCFMTQAVPQEVGSLLHSCEQSKQDGSFSQSDRGFLSSSATLVQQSSSISSFSSTLVSKSHLRSPVKDLLKLNKDREIPYNSHTTRLTSNIDRQRSLCKGTILAGQSVSEDHQAQIVQNGGQRVWDSSRPELFASTAPSLCNSSVLGNLPTTRFSNSQQSSIDVDFCDGEKIESTTEGSISGISEDLDSETICMNGSVRNSSSPKLYLNNDCQVIENGHPADGKLSSYLEDQQGFDSGMYSMDNESHQPVNAMNGKSSRLSLHSPNKLPCVETAQGKNILLKEEPRSEAYREQCSTLNISDLTRCSPDSSEICHLSYERSSSHHSSFHEKDEGIDVKVVHGLDHSLPQNASPILLNPKVLSHDPKPNHFEDSEENAKESRSMSSTILSSPNHDASAKTTGKVLSNGKVKVVKAHSKSPENCISQLSVSPCDKIAEQAKSTVQEQHGSNHEGIQRFSEYLVDKILNRETLLLKTSSSEENVQDTKESSYIKNTIPQTKTESDFKTNGTRKDYYSSHPSQSSSSTSLSSSRSGSKEDSPDLSHRNVNPCLDSAISSLSTLTTHNIADLSRQIGQNNSRQLRRMQDLQNLKDTPDESNVSDEEDESNAGKDLDIDADDDDDGEEDGTDSDLDPEKSIRLKQLRFQENFSDGKDIVMKDLQQPQLRRRHRTCGSTTAVISDSACPLVSAESETAGVHIEEPRMKMVPNSLGLRLPHGTVLKGLCGDKHVSSSENEGLGGQTPEGSHKAAVSSEEWEDRIQTDETTSSAYSSSCGDSEEDSIKERVRSRHILEDDGEERTEYTTSTLHVINLLQPGGSPSNSGGNVTQSDRVSCLIWEGSECKKVDLTALDIGWAIIDKVDSLPESSDYFLIGLLFSVIIGLIPLIFRAWMNKECVPWDDLVTVTGLLNKTLEVPSLIAAVYTWRQWLLLINSVLQRICLSLIFFFLLSVADRTFKQRLLYAKHFSYLTSSRRARKFSMPHFRLNKVRNIKIWLSLRSYLKRRGPQRSVDVIVSACFMSAICTVSLISLQMLKDSENYLGYLCNWELLVWCCGLAIFLMRFMTLGLKINKKYRNLSVLITEQINLYLQMEQKPHKKEELILANNVLRLAEDLLKELESPFKISGFSANPVVYNIMRVVVLSAFSAVLTEVLGFKLKLYKIKLKG